MTEQETPALNEKALRDLMYNVSYTDETINNLVSLTNFLSAQDFLMKNRDTENLDYGLDISFNKNTLMFNVERNINGEVTTIHVDFFHLTLSGFAMMLSGIEQYDQIGKAISTEVVQAREYLKQFSNDQTED